MSTSLVKSGASTSTAYGSTPESSRASQRQQPSRISTGTCWPISEIRIISWKDLRSRVVLHFVPFLSGEWFTWSIAAASAYIANQDGGTDGNRVQVVSFQTTTRNRVVNHRVYDKNYFFRVHVPH